MVRDYESPAKRRHSLTGVAVPTARVASVAARRAATISVPDQEPIDLSDLPDAALIHVLSRVDNSQQRHRLALVSRRFRRLCHSGPLLQRLSISLGKGNDEGQQFLPRLAALARWLKTAGGNVRQLRLDLRVPADAPGGGDTRRAFQALKQSLAAACPNLAELSIQLDAAVKASSWLAQLRGLTQLELSSAEGLRLTADLSASRQLERLSLRGGTSLRVATAAVLPASLTALELAGSRDEELPPQLSDLLILKSLTVSNAACTTAGFCFLAELGGSLSSLALHRCEYLPAAVTFQSLPRLQSLELRGCCPSDGPQLAAAGLQATLERLPQLTELRISPPCQLAAFPAALEDLHQLQLFEWDGPAPAAPQLPAGPWLLQLLHVELPADAAAASLAVLSAAWQLESLAVGPFAQLERRRSGGGTPSPIEGGSSGVNSESGGGNDGSSGPAKPSKQLAVVGWAARHPPLRHLLLQAGGALALGEDPGLAAALEEAAVLRPALRITSSAE